MKIKNEIENFITYHCGSSEKDKTYLLNSLDQYIDNCHIIEDKQEDKLYKINEYKLNEYKQYKLDAEWYEALYSAGIVAFNMLKDAWKAHDSQTDWEMIDKIARNIYIKTKPEHENIK